MQKKKRKLTRAEENAYRELAAVARRLRKAQERATRKANAQSGKEVAHAE
jgi:hypothetical protein